MITKDLTKCIDKGMKLIGAKVGVGRHYHIYSST